MKWDNLTEAKREFYRWFHGKECRVWDDNGTHGECSIMLKQREHTDPEGLRFYPEAIWGDPENPIWFIGMNPGQCTVRSTACERVAERRACANTLDDPDQTEEQYYNRHDLATTFGRDEHHPVLADRLTSAAFGLLLGQPHLVCVGDPNINRDERLAAVQKLTILNMAHCKCPNYTNQGFSAPLRQRFWQQCGNKNLDALQWRDSRLLVLFGKPPKEWLRDLSRRPIRGNHWGLEGWDPYTAGRLTCQPAQGQGREYRLLFLPHPSSHGLYDPERALKCYRAAPRA